ncbi:transmembrane protein, putative (macronuclear) [Tetrahymena thermophila SB210]|uniref:Transmembrane protein, putative n=1 Tax=Tetrahymena thermophila (strain SB210) TaxID=312017 RepID=Q23JV4_TETTS|nr:transmembrane protein, putative [Tetrahymena thermophila SB210]EAR96805.2 transmembrane protein, putative [Tetrahymena thermophila SB210]|eukprot:XP_001017050.2 transmembrane protein, putative [Tetrahymena thermophila SB210]
MIQQNQYFDDLKDLLNSNLSCHTCLHISLGNKNIQVSDLASELTKCSQITNLILDLRYNNISEQGASQLGYVFQNFSHLQNLTLDLRYCNIRNKGLINLVSGLTKCTNLCELNLNLRYNHIGVDGLSALGTGLTKFANIQNLTLNLEQNNINHQGASYLFVGLAKCASLSSLNLQFVNNKIGNQGALLLGFGLVKCINLQVLVLNLSYNQIGDQCILDLGNSLANCLSLLTLELELDYNIIGTKGMSGLFSSLGNTNITTLTLNLMHNQIIEKNIPQFSVNNQVEAFIQNLRDNINIQLFSSCTQIETFSLNLSNNKIGDQGAQQLGSALTKCTNLSTFILDLYNNKIDDRIEQKYSHIQMHSEYILNQIFLFMIIQILFILLNIKNQKLLFLYICDIKNMPQMPADRQTGKSADQQIFYLVNYQKKIPPRQRIFFQVKQQLENLKLSFLKLQDLFHTKQKKMLMNQTAMLMVIFDIFIDHYVFLQIKIFYLLICLVKMNIFFKYQKTNNIQVLNTLKFQNK